MTEATPANHQDTDESTEVQPSVVVTWAGPQSAEITVKIEACTPAQLWAAARMINHYGDDLYRGNQIAEQMELQRQQQEADSIARQLTAGVGGPITPARVIPGGRIRRDDA